MNASKSAAHTESTSGSFDLRAVYDTYNAAWMAHDPDRIVALHSADSSFWMRHGVLPVRGREALRAHIAGIFQLYPEFGLEINRALFGDRHWTMDYVMTAKVLLKDGSTMPIRVDMVDVVNVDEHGLVTRKDAYMDGAQVQEQLTRAGMTFASP
jgi:uncharacterized protein (TIGR02246 family)